MAALVRRGVAVAPFKVGPDFIDPGHHSRITGMTSRNLDGWMLSKEYNLRNFERNTRNSDTAVVEGVMGLYDGYDGKSESGSTAQMAKWLGLPVLLVVDAKSMARSAAAVIMGFERFDPELAFAGVVFNNLGSQRHLQYLMDAVQENVATPCLGGIVIDEKIAIPERHLGLVTQEDHAFDQGIIDRLADVVEKSMDLDLLLKTLPEINATQSFEPLLVGSGDKILRVAVARDNAFCFYYQDNLELLEGQGAELVFFSPIAGDELPRDIDGLYLGGGYPELFGDELAKNRKLREQVRAKSDAGMPIYGECGGFMYLCESLVDCHGNCYPMAGIFPFTTEMSPRLKALGYREITLTRHTPIGEQGMILRGHEFHYSELTTHTPVPSAYRISDRSGLHKPPDGYLIKRTLGSYNHLHFGSQPQAAKCFVDNCLAYQRQKEKRI
jgi:cobyrinic acid a,c-diamide synthase